MISFENVTEKAFPKVYEKMKAAFPYEERRDFSDQRKCLKEKYFEFFEIFSNNDASGFISIWNFEKFIFIEHLAIDAEKRGSGIGSRALEKIKELYKKPIILEVEPPEAEQQIKRIRFYEHLGFRMNPFYYEQPSYHGAEGVPLRILSFPDALSEKEFHSFLKATRKFVYKV